MVGLVIVSHSRTLAEGVAELARGMGAEVPIELAGGIDAPEPALGTDATRDLALPSNVRRYYYPSTTHGGGRGGFPV